MKNFDMTIGEKTTSLFVGNVFEGFHEFMNSHEYGKCAYLIDEEVYRFHGERLRKGFADFSPERVILVPSGERHKNLKTLEGIYDRLCALEMDRGDLLVAVGGGVVGDMGGFAAGTFKRGMDYINVPTTLLAQVDSSVGGKTAVNLSSGKNLAGMFHHPRAVFADISFLESLPKEILRDGMSELIKYGCIDNGAFFDFLGEEAAFIPFCDCAEFCVETALRTKMEYVEADEKDRGRRMLLNFGHTLAHALENHHGYGTMSHGEAVAHGMFQITEISESKGLTERGTAERLKKLLQAFGFDILSFKDLDYGKDLVAAMKQDKKTGGGSLSLVLLKRIGEAYLHRIPIEEIEGFFGMEEREGP